MLTHFEILMQRLGAGGLAAGKTRCAAIPAHLTDLWRERILVQVLNVTASGTGVKVDDRFPINFPVLLECQGLLIVGNVRHCVEAAGGGYILGLKIHRVEEAAVPKAVRVLRKAAGA